MLDEAVVEELFAGQAAEEGYRLSVDLQAQTVTRPDGRPLPFDIDAFRKRRLLEGLDDIGLTLQHAEDIRAYEQRRRAQAPWLFGETGG